MIFHQTEFLLLLGLYFIHYKITKKAVFIAAFLFSWTFSESTIPQYLDPVLFYLFYAAIYCLVYFILLIKEENLLTKSIVMTDIVVLCIGSAMDAAIYPNDETVFYDAYPLLYVFIHICIIISSVNWKLLRRDLGEAIDIISTFFDHVYHHSFFWYNLRKSTKEESK